jgi:hypothetical protein
MTIASDAQGRFAFEGLWRAEYTFQADFGLGATTAQNVALPDPERSTFAPYDQQSAEPAADALTMLALRCPPRARVDVEIVAPPGDLDALELWVARPDVVALQRGAQLLALRNPQVQLRSDGSLVVSRYRSAVRARSLAPQAQSAPSTRAIGSRVPLEVGSDGRVRASILVPPGELLLQVQSGAPTPAGVVATPAPPTPGPPFPRQTRSIEASLAAPLRVLIEFDG